MEHNNPFLESMLKLSKIHVLYSQTSNDGSQSNNPFLERQTFNDEKTIHLGTECVRNQHIPIFTPEKLYNAESRYIAEIIIATLKKSFS